MKFAVSTYSFYQLMERGEMSFLDCFAKAKEMGFDGVEAVDIGAYAEGDVLAFAGQVAETAAKYGLEIPNFAFGADFANGSDGDTKAEVRRVQKLIDAAQVMGASCIRHDVIYHTGRFGSFGKALPTLAAACREVTEYAAAKGIRTTTENHGLISQDSLRVEALYNAVDHPNFGLLVDMGNFLCVDESPVLAVSRVAPYAAYVHAKDFLYKPGDGPDPGSGFFRSRGGNYLRGTIIGHGCVPVKQCLGILKTAGYDGYVTVEYEGMEPVLEGIALGLENLRAYAAQL